MVGDHKPQFSLVGDTVNTASRMSSTIKKKGMIRISEGTYYGVRDVLKNVEFVYDEIEAKGKGNLNT